MPKSKSKKRTQTKRAAAEPLSERSPYYTRAVGKALEILDLLRDASGPVTLNKVSAHTRLTKSSAFRLLYTLEVLRCVARDNTGSYRLSAENRMALPAHKVVQLLLAAREPMRGLHMEFQETVSLAMMMNNHIEVVEVLESPHLIRMANIVGRILPPHASSMGKVIIAYQDEETRKKLLQSYGMVRYTETTITDERLLEQECERIRKASHSYDAEESTPGGCCFGIPVFTGPGKVNAAMSLSMPKARLPEGPEQQRIVDALRQAAQEISIKLNLR